LGRRLSLCRARNLLAARLLIARREFGIDVIETYGHREDRRVEDVKNRLAAERARKAEQDKAAGKAEDARLAAEKAKELEEAKTAAAEQCRKKVENAAANAGAERQAVEKAPADKLVDDKIGAEMAAKQAAAEPKVAAVAPSSFPLTMSPQELTQLARARLIGCMTVSVDGDWNASSQRSLTLFNK
jgi:hypothetical protein